MLGFVVISFKHPYVYLVQHSYIQTEVHSMKYKEEIDIFLGEKVKLCSESIWWEPHVQTFQLSNVSFSPFKGFYNFKAQ